MKVKNFTGFMLGNENTEHKIGDSWLKCDACVWVCPNLNKAKKVLEESQKCGFLESGAIWTKIYQVSGQDVVFEQGKNGLLYTGAPTKLYVNRVVYQKKPALITEEMLLKKAKRYSEFFELINGMEK